jgi:hypothetical protein
MVSFTKDERERMDKVFAALEDICDHVTHDLGKSNLVELQGYELPCGWSPRRTTIAYLLPKTYPQQPPAAVFVPANLQYHNGYPELIIKLRSRDRKRLPRILRTRYDHTWNRVCLHTKKIANDWQPHTDTLVTITRMIHQAAKHPEQTYPWEHRHEYR